MTALRQSLLIIGLALGVFFWAQGAVFGDPDGGQVSDVALDAPDLADVAGPDLGRDATPTDQVADAETPDVSVDVAADVNGADEPGVKVGADDVPDERGEAMTAAPPSVELRNLSKLPGIDRLVGVADRRLDRPLTVQVVVDGQPVAGRPVRFLIISTPPRSTGQVLSASSIRTDRQGRASVDLTLGTKTGQYVVAAFDGVDPETAPAHFVVEARKGKWLMFLIFGLLGGLGIFLIGMEMASEGLKEAAGDGMRTVLSALTSNRVFALLIGVVATAVLQSSSATTVMLVGFVEATMMTLTQAIGVTMGAKIGTTVTAQLIAFNLSEYSLLLVALGFLLKVIGRKRRVKQMGTVLLGFGLIFFGLGVMGTAMRPLRTVPEFTELLVSLGERPALGILLAVAFTAIVQSSAATIGLAIALCAAGLLSLEAALPLAWGAHIGTCATALLASLGTSRVGKRVAVAHLIFSVAGVIVAFPFLPQFVEVAKWLTLSMGSDSVARELANGHMIFTIVTGILFLPAIGLIEWLAKKIVPLDEIAPAFGPKYLPAILPTVPVLALEQAHREILRMASYARQMFEASIGLLEHPDEEAIGELIAEDQKLDTLERAIRPFLAQVAQGGLEPLLSAREHGFIYLVQDLEAIGDLITKELAPAAEKLAQTSTAFSDAGLGDLKKYHKKLLLKLDRVLEAIENYDRGVAEQVLQLGFKERILERKLRDKHLRRLHTDQKDTVETSTLHMSVLNNLRGIGEKLDDMARTILEEL